MKKRIIITGPTASGKTSLATLLAEQIGGEIISADSRQCYRQIDIGTAKPDPDQLKRIPHHNISVLDLDEQDSAAAFRLRAMETSEEIEQRGKYVIYCGGSTLHLQSLIRPLDDIPGSNPDNISRLNQQADEHGLENLFQILEKNDPQYAQKMDGLNRQRIIRALDVWMQTGKPFSSFHTNEKPELPENMLAFALHHPRKILHQRISARTDQMLKDGLIHETRNLLHAGFSPGLQALQTVGYKQAIQFLQGVITYEQMAKDIKTATRRYAKRQITWLRRWPFLQWIDLSQKSKENAVKEIISDIL